MRAGSLFSGAGLMDLGLARAGIEHAWFCESDPFCRTILERRWPDVPIYQDVREVAAPERVDLLTGGFPCQDVSVVGRRAGIGGKRSGLWAEFARLIGELRPRYVLVENVPGLLVRGMGTVLGDLAALGYDAEWDCLPAAAFGAPHLRARIFILAYPDRGQRLGPDDTVLTGRHPATGSRQVAHTNGGNDQPSTVTRPALRAEASRQGTDGHASGTSPGDYREWWATEPAVGRVANGVPHRVDRLRALGNGVVPQVAEYIGRRLMASVPSSGGES